MEQKTETYIIAVDMDGTLLNSQGQVTEKTAGILQRLLDMGHYVVPASGRSLRLLPKAVSSLKGLSWAVLENGSVVWDWKNSCVLDRFPMPEGMVERILADTEEFTAAAKKEKDYFVEFFTEGQVYADKKDLERLSEAGIPGNFTEYMLHDHIFLENFREQKELLGQAEKLNLFFEDMEFGALVRQRWNDIPEISVTSSVPGDVEFNVKGVNKGSGLLSLMKKLDIRREQIIAIGDSDNDLEMLAMAGIGVAMGNASDHVKNAADQVTGDNDHDGAAAFLETFFHL